MFTDFLVDVFEKNRGKDAIIWNSQPFSYAWLLERIAHWKSFLQHKQIEPGTVAAIEGDFSPDSVALFLALLDHGSVIVPFADSVQDTRDEFLEIAQVQVRFTLDVSDQVQVSRFQRQADHEFYQQLKNDGRPGLVLFSSGSTGKSKAAVHDLHRILEKFKTSRQSLRTISFLMYDHIGGINTLLYTLSNAGCLVTVQNRQPDHVLETIDKFQVELLPTSPTFMNLILLSEAYQRHNLSSLEMVTYGTEPMPENTLERFHHLFPKVKLLQTYGLSELGILRSKSESSDSLWVKIGGEGFQTRIVHGILHIKAASAMLGYLNAESPFTEDGWFNTCDAVETKGEYMRILGRKSEIINVGGEKVYPQEVESVIQELDNVAEITVYGEKHVITGNIVCAKVRLQSDESPKQFATRLKKYCRSKLEPFKVPVKVHIDEGSQCSPRFKKIRSGQTDQRSA